MRDPPHLGGAIIAAPQLYPAPQDRQAVDSPSQPEPSLNTSSLLARLESVRRRLLLFILLVLAGTAICWGVSDLLFRWLALPFTRAVVARGEDPRLVFTHLTDPFIVYFTVALLGGILLASPAFMAGLWQLLAPAVGKRRALKAATFVFTGTTLFVAGVVFGHQVLLPFIIRYLLEVAEGLEQTVTARQYLSFSIRLITIMGAATQLPLVSFTLARVGLVTASKLWRWFPYATLVAFTLAALITPPDGISQVLVAVPILVLYLASVLIAALAGGRGP